jgi:hypothetical protein
MTDTEKRDAVLQEFCEMAFSSPSGNEREERMAAEIVKLREAVARVRAVHNPDIDAPCDYCAPGGIGPCPTLTALEGIA